MCDAGICCMLCPEASLRKELRTSLSTDSNSDTPTAWRNSTYLAIFFSVSMGLVSRHSVHLRTLMGLFIFAALQCNR